MKRNFNNFFLFIAIFVLMEWLFFRQGPQPAQIKVQPATSLPAGLHISDAAKAPILKALGEVQAADLIQGDQRDPYLNAAITDLQEVVKTQGQVSSDSLTAQLYEVYLQWHVLHNIDEADIILRQIQGSTVPATQKVSVSNGTTWSTTPVQPYVQTSLAKILPDGLVPETTEAKTQFEKAIGKMEAAVAGPKDQRKNRYNEAVSALQEVVKKQENTSRDALTAQLFIDHIEWHALQNYIQAATDLGNVKLLFPRLPETQPVSVFDGQRWKTVEIHAYVNSTYDDVVASINARNSHNFGYQFIGFFAGICSWAGPYRDALALIILGTMVTLILTPVRNWQYKSAGKMAKLAPEIKKIQTQYKGQPEEINKKTMELYKEHGAHPLTGCLPMLVQLPFMWWLYWAIRQFQFEFKGNFFWIGSHFARTHTIWATPKGPIFAVDLSHADIPLLLLYTGSMYFYTKFMPVTSADPEQQAQSQRMSIVMSLMMPFMFYFYGWPSAFILWWLAMNVTQILLTVFYLRHHPDLKAMYERPAPASAGTAQSRSAGSVAGSKGPGSASPDRTRSSEATSPSSNGSKPTATTGSGPRKIEPRNRRKTRGRKI